MITSLHGDYVQFASKPIHCLVRYRYTKRQLTSGNANNNRCKNFKQNIVSSNNLTHRSSTFALNHLKRNKSAGKLFYPKDCLFLNSKVKDFNAFSAVTDVLKDPKLKSKENNNIVTNKAEKHIINDIIDLNKNVDITTDFNNIVQTELNKIKKSFDESGHDKQVSIKNNEFIINWIIKLLQKNYNSNCKIILNDNIWKWSYLNICNTIENDFLFKFYSKLIKYNVCINSNKFGYFMIKRLLSSSELDIQLVTMELFLNKQIPKQLKTSLEVLNQKIETNVDTIDDENNVSEIGTFNIKDKFIKLYDFNTNLLIFETVMKRKNWKFINFYLESIINKINLINDSKNNSNVIRESTFNINNLYFKFLTNLLKVLSSMDNMKLMNNVFELILQDILKRLIQENEQKNIYQQISHIRSNNSNTTNYGNNGDRTKNASNGKNFTKPILTSIRLIQLMKEPLLILTRNLRKTDNQLKILQYVKIVNRLPTTNNFQFKSKFIKEVLTSLRNLNDARLSTIYLINSIGHPHMSQLLNNFGLINFVFNKTIKILNQNELNSILHGKINKQKIEANDRPNLYVDSNNNVESKIVTNNLSPYLTELYLTVLQSRHHFLVNNDRDTNEYNEMGKINEVFKFELIQLFDHYCNGMQNIYKTVYGYRINTGVLNVFIDNCINKLRDTNLAIELLLKYYSLPSFKKSRISNNGCPFSLIIYYSYKHLKLNKIYHLLNIMNEKKLPLTFKICCAMVLKFDSLNRAKDAKFWYDKIYHGQFRIDDYKLINVIVRHGWELPPWFDFEKYKLENYNELRSMNKNNTHDQDHNMLERFGEYEALKVDGNNAISNSRSYSKQLDNNDDSIILPELENTENVAFYDKFFGILKKIDETAIDRKFNESKK